MHPLSDFTVLCLAELPGIPPPILNRLVARAARELCREGRLWRFVVPDITVANNVLTYDLSALLPACSMIHDIDVVTIGGIPLDTASRGANRISTTVSWTRTNNSIALRSYCDGLLRVQAVLIPTIDACSLPDILLDEWIEALEFGVKGMAMAMPKKEWSDASSGAFYLGQWEEKLCKARLYGRNGNATPRLRTASAWGRMASAEFIEPLVPSTDGA